MKLHLSDYRRRVLDRFAKRLDALRADRVSVSSPTPLASQAMPEA